MTSIKRVHIFNDCKMGYGTEVTDAETGTPIDNVVFVSLNIRPREPMRAVLHVANPVIDVIADADIRYVCPCCGKEKDRG